MRSKGWLVTLLVSGAFAVSADPWGKDADLCNRCRESYSCCQQRGPLVAFSEVMIGFHQKVISPADGPRSHFKPSSSQYTLDAIRRYGFGYGFLLGCDRLMRENNDPWVYPTITTPDGQVTKWDPVR